MDVDLPIGDAPPSGLNSDDEPPPPTPILNVDAPLDLSVFVANSELEPYDLPPFDGYDTSKPLARSDNCSHGSGVMRLHSLRSGAPTVLQTHPGARRRKT